MKRTKKMVSALMALVLTLTCWGIPWHTAYAALPDNGIMPCYNNADSLVPTLRVDDSGMAVLTIKGKGLTANTVFYISSYLEQEVSGRWVRVANGEPASTWQDVQQGWICLVTHSLYVGRETDCRAVVSIRITGSGTEDTNTITAYATFY